MKSLKMLKIQLKLWIQEEKKILALSLIGGLFVTLATGVFLTKAYSDTIQSGIAASVVRFHVLANSDADFDQELKLKVRNAILSQTEKFLSNSSSIEETKIILQNKQEEIKQMALQVIYDYGYDYDVRVSLSRDLFPEKIYGDVVFPAGLYDAVRIEIGKAEGKNWWCVLYPPLCFVDVSCEKLSENSKQELKRALPEEGYEIVVESKAKDASIVPEIKFKVVEWWQEWKWKKNTAKGNKGEIPWHITESL